jgi:hypothetical protein
MTLPQTLSLMWPKESKVNGTQIGMLEAAKKSFCLRITNQRMRIPFPSALASLWEVSVLAQTILQSGGRAARPERRSGRL